MRLVFRSNEYRENTNCHRNRCDSIPFRKLRAQFGYPRVQMTSFGPKEDPSFGYLSGPGAPQCEILPHLSWAENSIKNVVVYEPIESPYVRVWFC